MSDLEEAAKCLSQLADTMSKLKDTELVDDPTVMEQLEKFAVSMSAYNEKLPILQSLSDAANSTPITMTRPSPYLVKR